MSELRYIRSSAGRVHVLPPESFQVPDDPIRSGEEFAQALLAGTRAVCGRSFNVDWTETSPRRARPVGDFDDSDLCSPCILALGDEALQVFDRDAAWR